jgi:hypothetical protein
MAKCFGLVIPLKRSKLFLNDAADARRFLGVERGRHQCRARQTDQKKQEKTAEKMKNVSPHRDASDLLSSGQSASGLPTSGMPGASRCTEATGGDLSRIGATVKDQRM